MHVLLATERARDRESVRELSGSNSCLREFVPSVGIKLSSSSAVCQSELCGRTANS